MPRVSERLVIVGGGNMGAALVGGLLASTRPEHLAIAEALPARREQLAAEFPGVAVSADAPPCTEAVIAVKPGDVAGAVTQAVAVGARRLLSIAAGVPIAALEAAAGDGVAVVRAMPNTPALVGKGAAAIAAGRDATDEDLVWAESVLGAVGTVARVEERHLDAVTALTGSGPAYLFLVAEALIDASVAAGLARPLATALTIQLFVGSSALLADRGDPAALRAMVTSPAGTTAAGLQALERHAVRAAFADAVREAALRSAQLGG